MANVGYATLTVSPSMRGMQQSMTRQLGGIMPGAGRQAGRQLGAGIQAGTQTGVGRMAGAMGAVTSAASRTAGAVRERFTSATGAITRGVDGIGASFKSMAGMAAAFTAAMGLVNMASDIMAVASGAQNTHAVLDGLYTAAGHGAGEATKMTRLLNEEFGRSGIAMPAWQQGAQDLAYLGLNASETTSLMKFLDDAITATGGGADEVGRVTSALATMQNMGKASLNEINMLSQSGIPVFDMMTAHLGMTNEEFSKAVSNGEILIDDVLAAIEAKGGTWAQGLIDGAEGVNRTWSSAWDAMRSTIVNGIAQQLVPLLDRAAPRILALGDMVGGAFDALPGALSRVKGAMDQYGVTDALRSMYDAAVSLARGAAPMIGGFAVGFGAALGAVLLALGPVADLLAQLGEWMQNNTEVVRAFGVAVGIVAGAFVVLKGALAIGGLIAALANPIGLVAAAVGLLAAGLVYAWKNSETFRSVVVGAWEWVKNAVQGVVEWFTGTAWPAIRDWWNNLTSSASAASGDWAQAWESIKSIFMSVWSIITAFWNDHGQGIINGFKALGVILVTLWSGLWTMIGGILSGAWQVIAGLLSGALQIIQGILDVFIGLFTGDWQRMWDGIVSIGQGLWTAVVAIFNGLVTAIGGILKGLWDIITSIWEAIYTWLVGNSIVPDLVEAVVSWFEKMSDWLKGVLRAIANFFRSIWNGIVTTVRTVVDVVVTVIRKAWDTARTITSTVFQAVFGFINGIWNSIRSTVTSAVNTVRTTISNVWNTVRTLTTNAWQAIVSAVTSRTGNLLTTVRNLPGRILSALSNIGTRMRTVGRNIITGIINGVTGAASRLYNSLRNLASNALSAAKNALGISSPSRVFRDEVGAEVIAGLLGGIEAGQGQVDRALSDLVSARPALGRVQVPVSAEVSRHAAQQQSRMVTAQRAQVQAEVRNAQALEGLIAAIRAQSDGDFVLQVDSKEIARANRRGEHSLARR